MSSLEGNRTPEMRQRRERLSISRPCVELALGSLTIDGYDVAETRRFGNAVHASVDRFMVGRIASDNRRLSKSDAHRIWAHAFTAVESVESNQLSALRRGGCK